jgi:hypothetical protein
MKALWVLSRISYTYLCHQVCSFSFVWAIKVVFCFLHKFHMLQIKGLGKRIKYVVLHDVNRLVLRCRGLRLASNLVIINCQEMCTSSKGKPCGRLPFERPKRGWSNNIKRARRKTGSLAGKRMKENQVCVLRRTWRCWLYVGSTRSFVVGFVFLLRMFYLRLLITFNNCI